MPGMLRFRAWPVLPLLLLPLTASVAQVLPDSTSPPPVDTITPVPLPSIPYGAESLNLDMPKELKIDNKGGKIEGDPKTGVHLGGPIKVVGDNGMEMFSDTAVLDLKLKTVTLVGNVTVYQGDTMQRGTKAVYFYERKFLDTTELRASVDPLLLESGKFTVEQRGDKQVFVGRDAGITTDDTEHPDFWFRGKKTTIYPNDRVVFNNLRLYVGDVPVFWFPYLSQPLDAELGYHFIPGARSTWGPFLLNTYGIMLGGKTDPDTGEKKDAWLLSRWHMDLRASRGVGTGVDFADPRIDEKKGEISGFGAYYLNDMNPSATRSGIPRGYVDEDRFKLQLKHRWTADFEKDVDWRIDTNITYLSDRHYIEDFEMDRYQTDPEPDNTVGIYRRDDSSLLSVLMRFRVNDFYRSDTRLPEITYDRARAPWFGLPVLHEGTTSLGYIGEQADPTVAAIINPLSAIDPKNATGPDAQRLLGQLSGYELTLAQSMLALPLSDPRRAAIRTQLLDPSFVRFHTYQEFSMPMMLGGFLSLTPQAGIGYLSYGDVAGPASGLDRVQLHGGMEASVKFTRDLGSYQDYSWGIDGLKHVFQPYANWSVVSTNDFTMGDPSVDSLTPTTRPQPLDPMRFTALDQMQSWNILRWGARNRLLTQRDGQSYEWLYLDTYMDAFIRDPESQRTVSNLYNDVRWRPLPWLGLDMETQFPVISGGSGFSELNSRLHFIPSDRFDFSLGYRWLSGHPVLDNSDHFNLETYTRLSENWGFGTRHSLELIDKTLEYQEYTIHRDLGNWVFGVGVSSRDNRVQKDYAVVLNITLKDFPASTVPF